jgi:predicted dehydrogenase
LLLRDVDALVVATPDHWHALIAVEAALRGIHLYVETPLASTIPEGRAIVRAAERSGVVLQAGSQLRSSRIHQRIVDACRNGELGTLLSAEIGMPGGAGPRVGAPLGMTQPPEGLDYDFWLGPAPAVPFHELRVHDNWRWSYDYGGGSLAANIGLDYDVACSAFGVAGAGPDEIANARAEFADGPLYNTARHFSFEARYRAGAVLSVSTRHAPGLRILGSDGWASVTPQGIRFSDARLASPRDAGDAERSWRLEPHVDDFLSRVLDHDEPLASAFEAHRVATVAHLANLAFRSGRPSLLWDPMGERILNSPDAVSMLERAYRPPWAQPS